MLLRVTLAWLVSSATLFTSAAAHEVQPGVMDVEIAGDTLDLYVEWILEAPIAGLDLEGVADTNEAEGADEYDRLRALAPDALSQAFTEAWPDLREKITLRAGDVNLPLELAGDVPAVGEVELARTPTSPDRGPAPRRQPPDYRLEASGPLIVRQRNVEGGYSDTSSRAR